MSCIGHRPKRGGVRERYADCGNCGKVLARMHFGWIHKEHGAYTCDGRGILHAESSVQRPEPVDVRHWPTPIRWWDLKMLVALTLQCDDQSVESFERLREWWTTPNRHLQGQEPYMTVFMDSPTIDFERVLFAARHDRPRGGNHERSHDTAGARTGR